MMKAVIDTNVLLVANQQHEGVSPNCIVECTRQLISIQQTGVTVIDDGYRILGEYQNKTHPNQPKGPGDVFLKWLLRNTANPRHVELVRITETADSEFAEFPDQKLQPAFDPPDRKFAAVANAHPEKPPIWQAADCKWVDWWSRLKAQGISVEFLCTNDASNFYKKKFPEKPLPVFPTTD